jgi:hypothetical protein
MDDRGTLTMSRNELNRLQILNRVLERCFTQTNAAEQLGLSLRHVERLCRKLRLEGPEGLVSKKRGRPSNRRLPDGMREHALSLVLAHYADFGPTLAAEKLRERHGVDVSVETLRRWRVEAETWVPRSRRNRRVHQPRHRRSCLGELIQIDGCEHAWFEDRAPKCTLLVYVDDATSRLMELRFDISESTYGYFTATRAYLERFGKPVAFYSDQASIFRVANSRGKRSEGLTQFGRALSELNIDILCAHTPQAKGRVERAHLTLQDRLVKELRLRGISTLDDANAYAPEFIEDFNARFAKEPLSEHDAHRPVCDDENLELILSHREERKISKQLTLHYRRGLYLLEPGPGTLELRGKRCQVHEFLDGRIEIRYRGEPIPFQAFNEPRRVTQGDIVANKRLGAVLTKIQADQRERDEERLASPKVTRRRKQQIRAARERADAPLEV